jgi:hypothetical protein
LSYHKVRSSAGAVAPSAAGLEPGDVRSIDDSERIPTFNSDDLKAAIRTAFLEAPKRDPEAFKRAYLSLDRSLQPVTHEAYLPIIELNQFIDRLRRSGS